ncbi:MAG TPA: hypothetical protein VFH73_07425 [Polyangia bacterium]|nr:hypothetical protein [Polyangia bacterium]
MSRVAPSHGLRGIGLGLLSLCATFALGCGSGTQREVYPDASLFLDSGSTSEVGGAADVRDVNLGDRIIEPDDYDSLGILLEQGKLPGWIHAAVHPRGLYVFTYRKPNDFFSFGDFPLVAVTDSVAQRLLTVKRHDAVLLKGRFIVNKAPIHHIQLDDFKMVTPWVSDETAPPRTPEASIPADLMGATELIGKVHAVNTDGRIFVIEYKDAVIPVYVRVPDLTGGLYRNDKIHMFFEFAMFPPRPTHLWLDIAAAKPLEVMERLLDKHGKPIEAEGVMVRFPQSPQNTTDVYALETTDADGVTREYTLLNDKDPAIFVKIHDKLAAAWKSRPGQGIDGRNKLVNPYIKVKATGTFNLIAPNQANAQILLDGPDNLTITMLPPP